MATRWGICSTGLIAHDYCSALKSLPSSEHEVVAVAGRQKQSAEQFAKKYGIPAAYGSYEEMAKDPDVEIVYVGTIHPCHFSACMMFLDHGKHVLCEKPVTLNVQECKEVIAKAREKKLFFMEVVAVAGRQKQSAEQFAKKYGIPAAYGSYEEMAKDPDVEIVYVGTIHPCHFSACMMFLDHGKHVLCEKPVTLNVQECKEVIAKAREKKLFFMEGFWTRFFPAVHKMQELLKDGTLGRINFLRASFCLPAASVPRLTKKDLGGGGLMDLGCYLVQYANLVFRKPPKKIVAVGELNEDGVDMCGTLVLKYEGSAMAVGLYSIDNAFGHNTLTLYGSKGNLHLEEPHYGPTKIQLPSGESLEFPLPDSPYTYNFVNSQGLIYEARCVRECLQKGLLECPRMPHEDSVSIMTILEEAQRQLGVQYCPQS